MNTRILAVACVAALALFACSSSSNGSGSTTGTSGSGTGTTTGGGSSGSGGTTGATFYGCSAATAADHTSGGAVTINFGGQGGSPALGYAPNCIKVTAGTQVTFAGDFSTHPLAGGNTCTPDSASPITVTNSGTSKTFTLSAAGSVPYFCEVHCSSSQMAGAIFVQ